MKFNLKILTILFFVTLFSGCRPAVTKQDGIGSWDFSENGIYICLDLLEDGTFRELVTLSDKSKENFTGPWFWEIGLNQQYGLRFEDFHGVDRHTNGIEKSPATWFVIPERAMFSGKVSLPYSVDSNVSFEKREQKCVE